MGSSAWDAAQDAADAARKDEALSAASHAAASVASLFSADLSGTTLRPVASVQLKRGAEDQPVFVFELLVDLDDDLDVHEYPLDKISRLQDELRARIGESAVDDWDWIVNAGTRTGATAGRSILTGCSPTLGGSQGRAGAGLRRQTFVVA